MSLKDIVVIIIWAILVYQIFKRIFPPKQLLLISAQNVGQASGDDGIADIILKFSKRNDLYEIKDKIIYDDNNLEEIYKKCNKFDDILIGDVTAEARNDIIKHCFNNSRNIYVIPKISDILLKYSDDILVFDTPLFLSTNFGLSFENKVAKRIVDIVLSIFVLVVFMPIWLLVALLIKLEDGGPILFVQERVTINDKLFNIIKFRSMKDGKDGKDGKATDVAKNIKESKASKKEEVLPTIEGDERITKIGAFIRKYHIDEVPQLLNVLIGDMSLVGPRPERREHVELYKKEISEFEYRYKVKAGLTGLAQIYGKYNTSAIDKLKLDLIYIKRYSLIFDLELILRTLKVLIMKENTEGFDIKKQEYIKNNAK